MTAWMGKAAALGVIAVLAALGAAPASAQTLGDLRKGFKTGISDPSTGNPPLPSPPRNLFVRLDYDSPKGRMPAFVTPDPRDGDKHAAIVWLTGGDSNSLDDFWSPQPASRDQTARAFRDAGVVMMFPTLRGGNANPGGKEYFLGEVEDVLAAAEQLARLPYVDPAQVYLGGHSTGGTLALLVAESSGRFKAVFALGPVARVGDYPMSLVPHNVAARGEMEQRLRSPIYWLAGITSPTYLIEGAAAPGNIRSLEEICAKSANPRVVCIPVAGANHFSVISRITKVLAARIAVPREGAKWIVRPEEFR
jgi:alpha/beta superfamily hydrolase